VALFYQHNINEDTKIGIWRIEEPEAFFLEKVPVKRDVSHPYKRLQHLAGRYLLPVLFEDFPMKEILIADTRKPYLENEQYHFSISHCGNFAAALVSSKHRVGVDIELVTPRIHTISQKFLNDTEKDFLKEWELISKVHLELTTILWSAKESIYKWFSVGSLDFKAHMQLNGPITFDPNEWAELPFVFKKDTEMPLSIMARVFDPLVVAYVVT
jgi:4'-phosphopantetheinyl transferase EntD